MYAIRSYYGSFEARPPEDVAREIQATGARWVFLVDDNIAADLDRAKALCRALIPLKIRWVSQMTIRATRDRELMELLVV